VKPLNRRPAFTGLRAVLSKRSTWLITALVVLVAIGAYAEYRWQKPAVLRQQAEPLLPALSAANSGQRVLLFSPHADDETIAAAGFIALSLRNRADVRLVLVTDCNKHNNEDKRYTEFRAATAVLGIKPENLVFLELPDGRLGQMDPGSLAGTLKNEIDVYSPDIVVYPHPLDLHPDHAATSKAVNALQEKGSYSWTRYEYLVHYGLLYPEPRKFDPALFILPPKSLLVPSTTWQSLGLPLDVEDMKTLAAFTYRTQMRNVELRDLIVSSIRKNEILASPK
jgi:N-acetylglucosamine malate deacetylase 1